VGGFLLIEVHGARGADFLAGAALALLYEDALVTVDGIFQRHGLGVFHVGGFALGEPNIVGIDGFFGALLGAGAAADALGDIDVAGMLDQFDLEIPRFTPDLFDFAEGSQLDVQMPADLDQFG
jgi:hypothetical protein